MLIFDQGRHADKPDGVRFDIPGGIGYRLVESIQHGTLRQYRGNSLFNDLTVALVSDGGFGVGALADGPGEIIPILDGLVIEVGDVITGTKSSFPGR